MNQKPPLGDLPMRMLLYILMLLYRDPLRNRYASNV